MIFIKEASLSFIIPELFFTECSRNIESIQNVDICPSYYAIYFCFCAILSPQSTSPYTGLIIKKKNI